MTVTNKILQCRGRTIRFGRFPLFMGIVNATPDSFSDGGRYFAPDDAAERALRLLGEGADIIDIGGESTRPGAVPVTPDEETHRIVPVVERLRSRAPGCLISIDTRNSETAAAALRAGADIINDVSGLGHSPDMAKTIAEFDAGLVIMHMRGTPATMQTPECLAYCDVVAEVMEFFEAAIKKALDNGIGRKNIVLDPGIGFAKDLADNRRLLKHIAEFDRLGCPLLVGPSRKKFIGQVLDIENPAERVFGTAGTAVWLAAAGIGIIRVHDVKPVREAVKMYLWCDGIDERGDGVNGSI